MKMGISLEDIGKAIKCNTKGITAPQSPVYIAKVKMYDKDNGEVVRLEKPKSKYIK